MPQWRLRCATCGTSRGRRTTSRTSRTYSTRRSATSPPSSPATSEPRERRMSPEMIADAMEVARERIGDREAYVEVATGRRLSFGEWVSAADGVAAELAARGVGAGDVVAVTLPPSIDYAIACAAILRLGG